MKKALNNLKKSIPPKARIAILTAFLSVGVIAYLIFSILTSSSEEASPEDNGLVKVDTVIKDDTKVVKNEMLSTENSVSKQISDLNKKNIENKKQDENKKSYFAGISTDNKTNLKKDEEAEPEGNPDVVDLSTLFAETPVQKKEREVREKRRIEDLEKKLDIPKQQVSEVVFDRASFLSDVSNQVKGNDTEGGKRWSSVDAISDIAVNNYNSGDNSEGSSGTSQATDNNDIASLSKKSVDKRREQYMSRYNELKYDLEKRVNGNTQSVESDSSEEPVEEFAATPSESGDEYPSNKRYGAGEIIYAINDIEIVSSENNIVRATIAQNGDVYNAILLGQFKQIGDVLGISFDSYTIDNVSYTIDAVAIDAETWKSGLADDVDQHYFERYFGIITAALLEGYAESLTNQSQVNSDNGISQSQDRIEDASERLQFAIGRVGQYLAPKFLEGVNKPSTVTVFRDKGMGIMFMSDFRVPARK